MLDRQPLTLLVAVATLALTLLLYVLIPKGFFPVQDTGMIQAITAGLAEHLLFGDGGAAEASSPTQSSKIRTSTA